MSTFGLKFLKEKSPKSGISRPKSPHRQINLAHTNALAAGHAAYRLYDALETGVINFFLTERLNFMNRVILEEKKIKDLQKR